MGIFRDITKSLKKAAPIIGAGIGMYFGGAAGAALGSGIASSATGRSTEESLRNAALAGGAAYLAGGSGFGQKGDFTGASPLNNFFGGTPTAVDAGAGEIAQVPSSSSSFLNKLMPESTLGKIALISGGTALLSGQGEEDQKIFKNDAFPTGEYRGGKLTTKDDDGNIISFDGGDSEQRIAYYDQLERNTKAKEKAVNSYDRFGVFSAAIGGEVTGPGTGTSDSVPARLSDGEFVVTADAVRGAGGGDRDVGAARMYDMMSQLEGAA